MFLLSIAEGINVPGDPLYCLCLSAKWYDIAMSVPHKLYSGVE